MTMRDFSEDRGAAEVYDTDRKVALLFIAKAEREDVDRLFEAIRARDKVLRNVKAAEAAAAISVGAKVRTEGLSPKYLDGLTGRVQQIKGKRANVALDQPSAYMIVGTRFGPSTRPKPEEPFVLAGVPLSALRVHASEVPK